MQNLSTLNNVFGLTTLRVFKCNPTNYGELKATLAAITGVKTEAEAIYTALKLWFPALSPLPGLFLTIDVFRQCCLSLFVNQINSRLVPRAITQCQVGLCCSRMNAAEGWEKTAGGWVNCRLMWWDPGCDDTSRWGNVPPVLSLPFWLRTKKQTKKKQLLQNNDQQRDTVIPSALCPTHWAPVCERRATRAAVSSQIYTCKTATTHTDDGERRGATTI